MRPAPVLYLANSDKIGGGAKVLMDLILRLDRARFQPGVVVPAHGAMAEWANRNGVPCFVSAAGDWASATGLVRRTFELHRLIQRTGARIVHAAAPMCFRALGVAGRLSGAVRVCHLGFPPEPGELERSFLTSPDAVIGCYEAQALEHAPTIRRLSASCRTVGIANAVDIARFSPVSSPKDDIERWRFGARHVVAILGHISEVKGYPTFVQAAARVSRLCPGTAFIAVGGETAHAGYSDRVLALARELNLADRLHLIGFQADVAPILRSVDVVTLPSLSEGLPLAALEAMACGKAVVASAVGGVTEAIVDGVSGLLIRPGDADALADSIVRLLQDVELRNTVGNAARVRVEEHFTLDRFVTRIQDLYSSLLAQRLSPSI